MFSLANGNVGIKELESMDGFTLLYIRQQSSCLRLQEKSLHLVSSASLVCKGLMFYKPISP